MHIHSIKITNTCLASIYLNIGVERGTFCCVGVFGMAKSRSKGVSEANDEITRPCSGARWNPIVAIGKAKQRYPRDIR